ncbi:MAG TPA: hypothetical protein VHC96_14795 [Puia sp.]|nr:hypothetical protein [Puia sp.]
MNTTTNLRQTLLNGSKKVAIMMAMLLTLGASYSFANTPDSASREISSDIRSSFKRDFQNARIISAEVRKNFTKLTFRMDDMVMFAYYSGNGELLAITRNIVSSQLPLNLQMTLRNNYNGYWITELFELSGDNDNCYYVSLESADSKVTLRSNGDTWEVYSSSIKK